MKVMLFIWGQDMKTMLVKWAPVLSHLPQDFVLTPFIRSEEKTEYKETVSQLEQNYKRIKVAPIYLKSPDSRFRNLLNPYILLSDFSSIFTSLIHLRPDVVVCFYITHAYPLVILKGIFNFSLCAYAMGSDVNLDHGPFYTLVRRFVYSRCDTVFSVAHDLKEKIEKGHGCSVTVVPHGVNPHFFQPLSTKAILRQKWGIKPHETVMLTVCRLDKNKGVDMLIKAFSTLKRYDKKLIVVGEGPERLSLEELASRLQVHQHVIFSGFKGEHDLLELYNLADLFVLASYSEGLPRVLLEAMACGCICIATNVGDIPRVIVKGFNGFTVDPGDSRHLQEKIEEVLSLPEEERKLIQKRARRTAGCFDSRKLVKKMVKQLSYLKRPDHNQ